MQGESDNMEKKVQIGMLCEIYGNLLTKRQLNILNDYCNEDLSLTEIAENNKITFPTRRSSDLTLLRKEKVSFWNMSKS